MRGKRALGPCLRFKNSNLDLISFTNAFIYSLKELLIELEKIHILYIVLNCKSIPTSWYNELIFKKINLIIILLNNKRYVILW